MTRLKLSAIPDDKPVKLTIELPAEVFRGLQAYAGYLNSQHVFVSFAGDAIPPDKGFRKAKWSGPSHS